MKKEEKALSDLTLENARIVFRNFSGVEKKFNPAGRRNFCVLLESELAHLMEEDGWNVKWLQPRDEEEEPQAYIQVAVNYNNRPPRIVTITTRGQTNLTEETVGILDWAELITVDLTVRPYLWEVNGKHGIKAYCKSLYATLEEDRLADKYNNIPGDDEEA